MNFESIRFIHLGGYNMFTSIMKCRLTEHILVKYVTRLNLTAYFRPIGVFQRNMFTYCENKPIMNGVVEGTRSSWRKGALNVVVCALTVAAAVVVATTVPGPGSVLARIAITYAARVVKNEPEIVALQVAKSKSEGDNSEDVFNDVCESMFNNLGSILLNITSREIATYASGIWK